MAIRKSKSELDAAKQRAFQILRERSNVNIAALAREIGLAQSTVADWVRKFKKNPPAAPLPVTASDFAKAILEGFAEKSRELLESERLIDTLRSQLGVAEASVKYLEERLKEMGEGDIREKLEGALVVSSSD